MTTTDRRRASASAGASNLRLYLGALLAAVYVVAWWFLGARVPAAPAGPKIAAPRMSTPVATPRAKPAPVRAHPARARRIRTRSS